MRWNFYFMELAKIKLLFASGVIFPPANISNIYYISNNIYYWKFPLTQHSHFWGSDSQKWMQQQCIRIKIKMFVEVLLYRVKKKLQLKTYCQLIGKWLDICDIYIFWNNMRIIFKMSHMNWLQDFSTMFCLNNCFATDVYIYRRLHLHWSNDHMYCIIMSVIICT